MWFINKLSQEPAVLHIMDMTGKIIKTTNINAETSNQVELNVPGGIYFYQLNTTNGIAESGKLITQ